MKLKTNIPLEVSLEFDDQNIVRVGRLAYRSGKAYLEYDAGFRETGLQISPYRHRTVTNLDLPYDSSAFEGLHGVFADSLPDGWGRLLSDRAIERKGIEPATLTPLDRLAIIGSQGIGALTYAPETEIWQDFDGFVEIDHLATSVRSVFEGEEQEVVEFLGRLGGSPNGARPKALVWLDNSSKAYFGGQYFPDDMEPYMVKFPATGDESDIGPIEYAYSLMAREAGLEVSPTRLLEDQSKNRYFATRRFDLLNGARLHVHSASGLLYANPRNSAIDYADLLNLTFFITRDIREVMKMFRLAVFNVLSHNRDDHAKQFSYIMDREGVWKNSPAYDLTYSHGLGGEHTTAIVGFGKNVNRKHLLRLASKTQIPQFHVNKVLEEVRDAVSKWQIFAEEACVSKLSKLRISTELQKVCSVFDRE